MSKTIIHIDGAAPVAILDERGWTQRQWTDPQTGHVCAHQAIRLCQPMPGDAALIQQVSRRWGRGPDWNDKRSTTEADVREWLGAGIDVTDEDLASTFGPQWRAVVSLVRRIAVLTADECTRLAEASASALGTARDAAWSAAVDAAVDAAWRAAEAAAVDATWSATWDAAWAVVTWDLATESGPYTLAHRDLLIGPWREVCGLPEGLVDVIESLEAEAP